MAMAGRLRSTLSLFQRILRSDSLSSTQRSTVQRSLLCPTFTNPEFSKNYATASPPKDQKIKVPLTLFGVSGNYASALYLSAVKANKLDKVESELIDFVEASKRSSTFSQFMKDLSVPGDTRIKAIKEICAGAKFSDIMNNFLAVLAENGRLRHLESIAKKFTELTMAHRGEMKAIVTTVIPLPTEEEKELKETLQDIIGHGKKVNLEQKIDPSILGGLVVEFGQKVFDMSIKTRARQMERFLRDPVNLGGP
ncbi:ATP synthase subunit O like [Actinidia chinensis var. chinensis]|uniref:ATP synthase subunit O like n=1 Tax=Actinidia chinensis var. chinensis TaxID=1590841 RepID=A0A2R6RD40_ACTCC|nr:ATP synthase subunit O like [Actinidia chinensis var. chinensis]